MKKLIYIPISAVIILFYLQALWIRKEEYPSLEYRNQYDFDNFRWSGGLELDYSFDWLGQNFDFGSYTRFLKDRIKQISAGYPTFYHREWSEYAYVSMNGNIKSSFFYMLSLGTDLIFKKAGEVKHDYSKLTAAVSGTYKFNGIHSVRLNYNLSNLSPEVMYSTPNHHDENRNEKQIGRASCRERV